MCSTGACLGFSGLTDSAAFQGENHLADFDFRAFLDLDIFNRARHRRRNFHHGLVGFQFHHRLAFGDLRARRDHQTHQIALIDVLAQLGQLEFSGTGRGWRGCRRRTAAAGRVFGARLALLLWERVLGGFQLHAAFVADFWARLLLP